MLSNTIKLFSHIELVVIDCPSYRRRFLQHLLPNPLLNLLISLIIFKQLAHFLQRTLIWPLGESGRINIERTSSLRNVFGQDWTDRQQKFPMFLSFISQRDEIWRIVSIRNCFSSFSAENCVFLIVNGRFLF